jgi:enamine deaminase RidA (YjgF/YER057c/UK114 family)
MSRQHYTAADVQRYPSNMHLLLALLLAQTEFPQSKELPPANGYSHVVTTGPGKMIFISGQVAMNREGKVVGVGDFRQQTEQALLNLKAALSAAGADFNHVVKLNWYVKNFKPEQLPILREVRARYLNKANPPASTLAGVSELFLPDVLIEVEAIAVIPSAGQSPNPK